MYRKLALLFTVILLFKINIFSQNISEMEFNDSPVRDILLVLAQTSGRSIISDETVDGYASYYFTDMDLDTALDQFLSHYGIYYRYEKGVYYVSKIKTNLDNGTVSCQAEQVDFQLLIQRLSRDLGITILHDALPRDAISVNYQNGTIGELLEILIKPYHQFYLESGDRYFYLRKEATVSSSGGSRSSRGGELFTRDGRSYEADFQQIRFREALTNLLDAEGIEYSFLGRNDNVIEQFRHKGRSFEEMLNLLLEQGNASYQEAGGVYYIFDLDRQNILKRYFLTEEIELENLDVDKLTSLIPSSLNNSGAMKISSERNTVILNGTLDDIAPLEDFIRQLDEPSEGKSYKRYDLQFITLDELTKRLGPEMMGINMIPIGERSFLASLNESKHGELASYLPLVDSVLPVFPIQLHYLTWEELQDLLPPNVEKDQIKQTQDPALLFFQGTRGEKERFEEQLLLMDKPMPQLRYEVLVLQIEENQGLNLDSSLTASSASDDSSTGFTGALAGLASLNFDVVSQFGYQFAAGLSLELTNNQSRVLADTTLHGLSGEEISFQNTNTSRIATTTIDSDTGETEVTGYTEITSGLIVEITGTVSGDGMITMEVTTTISSETNSSSDDSDTSVPATTEKVVTTHIRSQSGEPVILSGLKQRETMEVVNEVPILGDIPLLGYLFQNRNETMKNTEFIITLIPYKEEDILDNHDRVYSDTYYRYCRRDL